LKLDTTWRNLAACRGKDIVLFFGRGEDEQQKERLEREARAKALCLKCSVQQNCLQEALLNREEGVWGGLSKYERKRLLRQEKRVKPKDPRLYVGKAQKPQQATVLSSKVVESRIGWDGERVLIKCQDFVETEFGVKWIVEKNDKVLYETTDETDAWLMFASWTVTF